MTLFKMSGITYSPSYTVDLVTLPASPPPRSTAPARVAKPEEPKPPAKKPEKEITKPAVSPPPPAKPAEKIETVKPSGGDEAAQAERRRRIEELELEARRLYNSFTAESGDSAKPADESADEPETAVSRPAANTGSAATAGGQAGRTADLRFKAYYDRIWGLIRSSWVLPEGVASEGRLLTVVGIRISPDGFIEQYWIEKKSGNEYYDQSALRAIRKSSPLPGLPKELGNEPLEVGINFRYPE
jgi:TonB family protein